MNSLPYIDFHTHHPSLRGEWVVQDGVQTSGCHPWHLLTDQEERERDSILDNAKWRKGIWAIGESGLDKLCDTPYALQLQMFEKEVRKSEKYGLPLYLHCVRAIDDVLRIRSVIQARQPIIWHGYRGNAEQIRQLLARRNEIGNFYFSFGFRHREDALQACPLSHLLLETDDDTVHSISQLYDAVAATLGLPLEILLRQMHDNYHTLFNFQYISVSLHRP